MRRLILTAKKPSQLFLLVILLSTLFSTSARADIQSEVITLEDKAVESVTLILQIVINGKPRGDPVLAEKIGDEIAISASDLLSLDLDLPSEHSNSASRLVFVSDLPVISHKFDPVKQTLELEVFNKGVGANQITFGNSRKLQNIDITPSQTMIVVNYDIVANASADQSNIGGIGELRLTNPIGNFSTDARVTSNSRSNSNTLTRLNSRFTYFEPEKRRRYIAGDILASGNRGTRAIRLGGLQIATDNSLDPELITFPLASLEGTTAVPSAIDILVNGRTIRQNDVEAGDFSIRNIPIVTGRGEVGIIVRDTLGRESIQTRAFYASRNLLSPGLAEYQANIGFVRRNFGILSNDYRDLSGTASFRYGVTKRFTANGDFQVGAGVTNSSIGGEMTIGAIASVHGGISLSYNQRAAPSKKWGTLATFGIESLGRPVSFSAAAIVPSKNFSDLVTQQGDPPPPMRLSATISFDLADYGSLSISGVRSRQRFRDNERYRLRQTVRSNILTANYRANITDRLSFNANLFQTFGNEKETSFFAGLSLQFGARSNATVSVSSRITSLDVAAGVQKSDIEPGDFGYRVEASLGGYSRLSAQGSYQTDWARFQASAESFDGRSAVRANMSGAFVISKYGYYAAQRINNAFAIVDTQKISGVVIEKDNRAIGITDDNGYLLVTDLRAWESNKISYNPMSLSESVVAGDEAHIIRPPGNGGVIVAFDMADNLPVNALFVYEDRKPVPPGSVAIDMQSGTEYLVGMDGEIFIANAREIQTMKILTDSGEYCRIILRVEANTNPYENLGVHICNSE